MRFIYFVYIVLAARLCFAQTTDVPIGVKLTPDFRPPSIVANAFSIKHPEVNPAWSREGDLISATFKDKDQSTKTLLFYENGISAGYRELSNNEDRPATISEYLKSNFPEKQAEVWRYADSTDITRYFAKVNSDTLWFNENGGLAVAGKTISKVSGSDAEYITQLASAQIMEVTISRLAAVNSANTIVIAKADERVKSQTSLNSDLKSLAGRKGIRLPTELDKKQQKEFERLRLLQGEKFDKEFASYLMDADKKNKTFLKSALKHTEDNDLKNWTAKALSVWEQNAKASRDVFCKLK